MALCCVLGARRAYGIVPILSEKLKEVGLIELSYSESDVKIMQEIRDCFEIICTLDNSQKSSNSSKLISKELQTQRKHQQYLTQTVPKMKS